MIDIRESVYRIVNMYNDDKPLGLKAIYGKNIVSEDESEINQNTLSTWILKIKFSGSPAKIIEFNNADTDNGTATIRYEPMVQMRAVFTGKNFENNAMRHYNRVENLLSGYQDQSLRNWMPFTDASIFFETRYLNRMQADAFYLVYYDIVYPIPLLKSSEEILYAYANGDFTEENFLTQRKIEVPLNGD